MTKATKINLSSIRKINLRKSNNERSRALLVAHQLNKYGKDKEEFKAVHIFSTLFFSFIFQI